MPFLSVKSNARQIARAFRNLRKRIFPTALEQIHRTGGEIVSVMRKPGKPVAYPIDWQTPKQQQAFFASNGFGRGIPTKRTDETPNAWHVTKHNAGVDIANPLSHAGFVYGTEKGKHQQRMHKGRHPLFISVVREKVQKLPKKIKDKLIIVIRGEGFRVKE